MSVTLDAATKRFAPTPGERRRPEDGRAQPRAAVDGVSVEIETGSFFVVLGPSGCGKSTLLRLIAGLETLDAGAIRLGGRAVAGPALHLAPEERKVGVVFQSYALWPHMTAAENAAFPIEAMGVTRAAALAEAERHLETVALQDYGKRKPAELSGGQRQRVALARCLAGGARTILMDEPLANLDPHLRGAMEEELAAFHRRAGATTLFITHDQREAMALADRIAVMRDGRFEQIGAPETVYARPENETVARFIGRGAILDGAVEAAAAGRAAVRIGARVVDIGAPPSLLPGPARVLIRPEDVALGAAADAAPARIERVAYRGGVWEGAARLERLAAPLEITARVRLTAGETVPVRIAGGWVLPRTG